MTVDEEVEFVRRAFKEGTVKFIRRYENYAFNRYLVTVGNCSVPINISDELWRELKP